MKYFGHIKRNCGLETTILEGKASGKRGRGRPGRRWIQCIKETLSMYIYEVRDREAIIWAVKRSIFCEVGDLA
jgi:hypothetical protein